MIDLLKKLSGGANVHLWTVRNFAMNPLHELKEIGMDYNTLLISVGEACVMCEKLENSIRSIEAIEKYCVSEIKGTFYEDFEKQWEKYADSDIKPEYTPDTVYKYILGIWDSYPKPEIDDTVKAFVEVSAEFNTEMMGGIVKFFPEAGLFKQNKDGEMEKSSLLEHQIDENLKAGSTLAAIEDYNERLAKIKAIATNKGNLGEILKLIHSSR